MLNIVFADTPMTVSLIESHPDVKTLADVRQIFRRSWMERGDKLQLLESKKTKSGKYVTPVLVLPMDGEPCDVFGQWITDEPPH